MDMQRRDSVMISRRISSTVGIKMEKLWRIIVLSLSPLVNDSSCVYLPTLLQ